MKKCVIIYNPVCGKEKNKECIEDFYTTLKKYDYDLELIYTKEKGDATRIIKELSNPDLVICAGGDGTLNEVIKGNLTREDRLLVGVLPLGTTNDVGNMLGYSKDYVKNLEMLLSGQKCKYDIGTINNNPFVYVASIGGLTNISYATPGYLKRKLGHLAYIVQAFKEVTKRIKSFNLRYKVNGRIYQGNYSHIFITNATNVAGKKNVYQNVKLNDHLLEVAFLKISSKLELIKTFYYIMTSRIEKISGLEMYKTSQIEITFDNLPTSTWCVDGEELKVTSSKVKITVNSDHNMLVPTKNIDKLFK